MDKRLLRTKAAIDDCEKHLTSSGALGTEIESYLTQHILVILCADIQQEIYIISEQRAEMIGDPALVKYVSSTARKVLRSVGKSEIATFVGMFGSDAQKKLNALIDDSDVTIFNNAVSSRHDVAHKQGAQITFRELKDAVAVAERLLEAVENAIHGNGTYVKS
jgi:hypothetical protein